MRLGISILMLAMAAGCSPPTDPTPNRPAPSNGDYPPGPYGYGQGTIMGDLLFEGKSSPMPVDYSTLVMQPIPMSAVRQTAGAKLILIEGGAQWCPNCQLDQPTMRDVESTYAPQGVVTLEVLVEGGYGVAATDDTINRWAQEYMLSGTIAIDPGFELAKYADVTAFPIYIVVRASTMKVEYMQVDSLAASPIGPVLDSLLAQ